MFEIIASTKSVFCKFRLPGWGWGAGDSPPPPPLAAPFKCFHSCSKNLAADHEGETCPIQRLMEHETGLYERGAQSSSQNMANASPLEVTAWKSSTVKYGLSLLELEKKTPKYMHIKCTFSPPPSKRHYTYNR